MERRSMATPKQLSLSFIIGATGCGKTAVSVGLARAFKKQHPSGFVCVINCDVLQFYQGLPISTNKAAPEELSFADGSPIPHYFMSFLTADGRRASFTPTTTYHDIVGAAQNKTSVADPPGGSAMYHIHDYVREVEAFLHGTVFKHHYLGEPSHLDAPSPTEPRECLVLVCGGSHYYAQSLLFDGALVANDANSPPPPMESDEEEPNGSVCGAWDALQRLDPEAASQVHPQNGRRIARMLALARQGRHPSGLYAAQRAAGSPESQEPRQLLKYYSPMSVLGSQCAVHPVVSVIWVDADRDWLNQRLDARVDDMMTRGMLNEVMELGSVLDTKLGKRMRSGDGPPSLEGEGESCAEAQSTLLTAIGYKEWIPLLREVDDTHGGQIDLSASMLARCVQSVKHATRRYAKQQVQWIRNRFLGCGVYRSQWKQRMATNSSDDGAEATRRVPFLRLSMDKCLSQKTMSVGQSTQEFLDDCIATDILPVVLHSQSTSSFPAYIVDVLAADEGEDAPTGKCVVEGAVPDRKTLHRCEVCDVVASGEEQWASHQSSKRHRGALRHAALVETQRTLGREIPPRPNKRSQQQKANLTGGKRT